jgi:hypothetical protein
VYAQYAQKGQQESGNRVINGSGGEPEVCLPVHGRDKEKINYPTYSQKTKGEKVNSTNKGFSIVEAMRACKTEEPENISYGLAMGITIIRHFFPFSMKSLLYRYLEPAA